MATIAQNLQKIINSKAAIKTSINNKGGSITDETPLDEYSTAIDNLPSGSGSSYVKPAEDTVVESYATGTSTDAACTFACYLEEIKFYSKYQYVNGSSPMAGNSYAVNKTTKKVTLIDGQNSIGASFFKNCPVLEKVLGTVTLDTVGSSSFAFCSNLKVFTPSFSLCTSIGDTSFKGCGFNKWYEDHSNAGQLGDLVLKDGCTVGNQAFSGANFNSIYANCPTLGQNALAILGSTVTVGSQCTSLHYAVLSYSGDLRWNGSSWSSVSSASNVTTLIMKGTTPPNLTGAFNPNVLQHIYVPSSAVNTYKTASNWQNFASIIEADPNE